MKTIIVIAATAGILAAQNPPTDEAIKKSVDRGLEFLAKNQNTNGSWTCKIGYKLNDGYYGEEGQNVGVTSICGLAFLASGNFPDRGKYKDTVRKSVEFVLSCVREEDGYITHEGSRMYEHAFATLFLAHIYGMAPTANAKLQDAVKRAVYLLVQAQNSEGGWRYQPQPIDADISVTVSVLQALRAARNVGVAVPKVTIDKAIEYIQKCAFPEGFRPGFQYQSTKVYDTNDQRRSYALAACGVVALFSLGTYNSKEVAGGIQRIKNLNDPSAPWGSLFYFYAHYYAAQGAYMAGGEVWKEYWGTVSSEIIAHQDADGAWTDDVGRTYAAGMACLILQIPKEWFPIIQK